MNDLFDYIYDFENKRITITYYENLELCQIEAFQHLNDDVFADALENSITFVAKPTLDGFRMLYFKSDTSEERKIKLGRWKKFCEEFREELKEIWNKERLYLLFE